MSTVLAGSLALGVGGASAGRVDPPGHRDANHCVTPAGVDLNALFGVSDQIITRFCLGDELGDMDVERLEAATGAVTVNRAVSEVLESGHA